MFPTHTEARGGKLSVGAQKPKFRVGTFALRHRPKSLRKWPSSPNTGRTKTQDFAIFAQDRSMPQEFGPNLGRNPQSMVEIGPEFAEVGHGWSNSAQWVKLRRIWWNPAGFGGGCRPDLGRDRGPNSVQILCLAHCRGSELEGGPKPACTPGTRRHSGTNSGHTLGVHAPAACTCGTHIRHTPRKRSPARKNPSRLGF